ncbi:hypothetical protein MIMGU_mgv1a018517mg [Erythranthe guttata]|uniref:MATH domain-containing protein n=1 Tax=Erythranthe guttata TaxID=4155 RepID=A0A022RH51_ERYGU|nr:hypothetical protein MIMGU_mgv1a018517mg [Erythranthe guttata]
MSLSNRRLIIYPSGKEKDYDHISVYLAVVETSSLPENWEFNAIFTIFLYNQIYDKYLCFRVKRSRLFNKTKSEWGFPKFMALMKMKLYRKGDSSSVDTLLKICLVCVSAYTFATHQKVKADSNARLIGKSKSTTITLSSRDNHFALEFFIFAVSHWFTSSKKSYGTTYTSLDGLMIFISNSI